MLSFSYTFTAIGQLLHVSCTYPVMLFSVVHGIGSKAHWQGTNGFQEVLEVELHCGSSGAYEKLSKQVSGTI